MKLEGAIGATFAAALAVSSTMALIRFEEEFARRGGLKGTKIIRDADGRNIEYALSRPSFDGSRPVVVLENGLGAPLECWDWLDYLLRDNFDVLRYHRRGYARTKSRMRPAAILNQLLATHAPTGPLIFVSHSIGALITANVLLESPTLLNRTESFFVIDGTDGELLDDDRQSKQRVGRFKQTMMQEALASITGMNRWVTSTVERDVEYRPDIQRSFLTEGSSVRSHIASLREYLNEPTVGQSALAATEVDVHLLSAADNVEQQARLAARLGASFSTIQSSSHRSIIGKLPCAAEVAELVVNGGPHEN